MIPLEGEEKKQFCLRGGGQMIFLGRETSTI